MMKRKTSFQLKIASQIDRNRLIAVNYVIVLGN